MATITKRKKANGKATYTAQVRIKKGGQVVFSKSSTFPQRKLAEKWATRTEQSWKEGSYSQGSKDEIFSTLIKRYRHDIENEVGKTLIQCLRTLEAMEETKLPCDQVDRAFLIRLARAIKREG